MKIEESKKPKKWKSSRAENKKDTKKVEASVPTRQFNPRLPPYKFVKDENKKETDKTFVNDEINFPTLWSLKK